MKFFTETVAGVLLGATLAVLAWMVTMHYVLTWLRDCCGAAS